MHRPPVHVGRSALATLLLFSVGLLHTSLGAPRAPVKAGALPTTPELEKWLASTKEIERGLRKGEARYTLEIKKAHLYAKVLKNGEVIGRFRPETTATSARAEITTFNLGRALGCGELFQPAVPFELEGKGLAVFRRQLEAAAFPEHRKDEHESLLQALENEPDVLRGVYKPMVPAEAVKYTALERPEEAPNGGLETNHPIARALRHDAPQPGHELIVLAHSALHPVTGVVARQLSDILLVDALTGQWDRFSSHNLHLVPTPDGAQFMAIDNGGADPLHDQGYLEKFTHWVTRFDAPVAEQLSQLDAFLKKGGRFRGFATERALSAGLGFDDAEEWAAFKQRVHRVQTHVRAVRTGGTFEP